MGLGDLDVTKSIFGSGSSPGVMGTGQQRFNPPQLGQPKRDANGNIIYDMPKDPQRAEDYLYGRDPGDIVYEQDPYKAWQDPMAEQRRGELAADKAKYEGRQLTGDARIDQGQINKFSGVSIAPAERYGGAQVGQFERGQAAQLSPAERIQAERVGNINIGQAQGFGGAQIDPAAQARAAQLGRQDQQFRAGQTGLMSQLQEQAAGRGPSLAGGQLQEASERTLAQQAGAAAAGGGSSALARRQLAANAAQQNQQTARDVAQVRLQEQLAARQQLAGVTQTGREQDINVANAQAQLIQQANLANQAAINQRAGQQAGLTQQAGMFSAEQMNQRQYQQAQLNAQLSLANQQAGMQAMLANQQYGNQFALQQGQFGQQMNLANMQAQNERTALQAQLQQQAGLANQQYANQFALQQGAWAQQAGLANQQYMNQALFANQQAAMQQQQLNDAMARYYTEAGLGLDARQQQAMMAYQALQSQQALGYAGLEQRAYEGAREGIGGMMGGIGSAVGALAMFSDEEVKNSVTRGDQKIGNFLEEMMQNQSDTAAAAMKPDQSGGGDKGGMFGGFGGAISSAGAASAMGAMSDEKAKNLQAENDKLKAVAVGQAMSSGAKGKGFFGGLGSGVAAGAKASMAQDKANAAAVKKPDPSSQMTPVMNNPNAAIAVPGGPGGAAAMAPSYGGLPVRENPYPAPPMQTWGVPAAAPAPVPPTSIPANMTNAANPYDVPQTWSDERMKSMLARAQEKISQNEYVKKADAKLKDLEKSETVQRGNAAIENVRNKMSQFTDDVANKISSKLVKERYVDLDDPSKDTVSYSPIGMKQNIGSGDMRIQNFLNTMNQAGSGPSNPMDYGSGFGGMSAFSDERVKELLDTAQAHDYEYKDQYKDLPGAGEGRFVSPMAQELQKTELGKSMVKEGPDGKLMVDYGKGFGTILAAQAYLNERLNELEAKKGKK